ncbi:MAG TPA: flavodoxin domain-containing protein [Candidatus Binatia bacterium]|nr:flavodoxin domain-containing protein [Candidatus Binatia bacterium]
MKVLVSAATKHGATAEIAEAIAEVLTGRGFDVVVAPPESLSVIDDFDAAVLGSGVYFGHWLTAATDLVERSTAALRARPVWLFSSGPVGEPPKPAQNPVDVSAVVEATGAREHRLFGGRIARRTLSFSERAMVAALRVQEADSRDWAEIRGWASAIADSLDASR